MGNAMSGEIFCDQKPKFYLDAMLGRLAKWLRVLGYDAVCRRIFDQTPPSCLEEGRILLTRHKKRSERLKGALFINENRVGKQLAELRRKLGMAPNRSQWFSRCLLCNSPLEGPSEEQIRANVPDYVCQTNLANIRFCPACGRFYWPGTHRKRMQEQLLQWGF